MNTDFHGLKSRFGEWLLLYDFEYGLVVMDSKSIITSEQTSSFTLSECLAAIYLQKSVEIRVNPWRFLLAEDHNQRLHGPNSNFGSINSPMVDSTIIGHG